MEKEFKRIGWVLLGICLLFISLILYLSYFQIVKSDKIKESSYNKRLWLNEEKIKRGNIVDRNDNVLAYSEKKEDDTYKRLYNYGNLYSHIIGYSYRSYGKVGLELKYNNTLLNISENTSINEIKNAVNPNNEGNNLRLTLDHEIQSYTREALKGRKGAVVAMNPKTGEIYSMVSLPDFNAANLNEDWTSIVENKDSPFLNRATSGLYPPGSTFKILTGVGLLESMKTDKMYNCEGSVTIDGYTINDYSRKPHGNIDLATALEKSCNSYFAAKGVELGKDTMMDLAERFYINKIIPFEIPTQKSRLAEDMSKTGLAATSIGQGKLLMTPLNMAMISSTIANEGEMMKPILVKNIISAKGNIIRTSHPEVLDEVLSQGVAEEMKSMMEQVVDSGTGREARIKNTRVAGKTGTAENASGKNHAWFTGFAPVEDPRVAIAVILEEDGSTGGKAAAPLAGDIMKFILNKLN